jgi:uncharacterized protein (TIGR03089 family)
VSALITDRLRHRVRTAGADPLITYYELPGGVRTELSAVTLANWVDKTSNLLVDDYAAEPGDVVELAVAVSHPGHWVTTCWELACWQCGLVASAGSGLAPSLLVAGPDWAEHRDRGPEVLACALHPLGLGFREPLPAGVIDYALEVRGQPDSFAAAPQSGLALAWADPARQLTQAELLGPDGPAQRRLVRPSEPWPTCRDGIVTALVTGGSVVIVVGEDPERLAAIVDDERVDRG